jgi:hypothetical protein
MIGPLVSNYDWDAQTVGYGSSVCSMLTLFLQYLLSGL